MIATLTTSSPSPALHFRHRSRKLVRRQLVDAVDADASPFCITLMLPAEYHDDDDDLIFDDDDDDDDAQTPAHKRMKVSITTPDELDQTIVTATRQYLETYREPAMDRDGFPLESLFSA